MPSLPDSTRERWRATVSRFREARDSAVKRRGGWRWIAFGVVLWFFGPWGDGALRNILADLWGRLFRYSQRPVGEVGLVLLAILAGVILVWVSWFFVMAWRETRPKPPQAVEEQKPEPTPLTDKELHAISEARKFWRGDGNGVGAVGFALLLLRTIPMVVRERTKLVMLLHYPQSELQTAKDNVEWAVSEHSATHLRELNSRFEVLYRLYLDAVCFLEDCDNRFEVSSAQEIAGDYAKWVNLHPVFLAKLKEMSHGTGFSDLEGVVKNGYRSPWC